MKQARKWLPIAAALLLLPEAALAQKGPPKKPAASAPAPAPASGEIELDAPATPPAVDVTVVPGGTPGTPTTVVVVPSAPGAAGGICEIDPSACPKTSVEDLGKAAKKSVAAEVYAVQQIYALRNHRLELKPYWGFSLNDQFVSHPGPGLDINYYITNVLAIGLNGNYYGGLNQDSNFNFEVRRSAHLGVPLTTYREGANLNFTYVPVYGKFAGFSKFIFHYDAYVLGGLGYIDTAPIAVIDPDNRKFGYKPKLDFDVGIGLRIFFNRWFAVNLEIRDYIYNEQLENTKISATDPTDASPKDGSAGWYGGSNITNNVQAQLGFSVFLPFSWEYRLPK